MTAYRRIILECDRCYTIYDDPDSTSRAEAVLRSGWKREPDGTHLCVSCQSAAYRAKRARHEARRAKLREYESTPHSLSLEDLIRLAPKGVTQP